MRCGEHMSVADKCSATEPFHLAILIFVSQARSMRELLGHGGSSADDERRIASAFVQGLVDNRSVLDQKAELGRLLPNASLVGSARCRARTSIKDLSNNDALTPGYIRILS